MPNSSSAVSAADHPCCDDADDHPSSGRDAGRSAGRHRQDGRHHRGHRHRAHRDGHRRGRRQGHRGHRDGHRQNRDERHRDHQAHRDEHRQNRDERHRDRRDGHQRHQARCEGRQDQPGGRLGHRLRHIRRDAPGHHGHLGAAESGGRKPTSVERHREEEGSGGHHWTSRPTAAAARLQAEMGASKVPAVQTPAASSGVGSGLGPAASVQAVAARRTASESARSGWR